MKINTLLPNLSILMAIASSLCCIMPVLAVLTGIGGIASGFSWLEPARPYFLVATLLILGLAWYRKLKPKKGVACDCGTGNKTAFWQTKTFLGILSVLVVLFLSFPIYSGVFFTGSEKRAMAKKQSQVRNVEFTVSGMTCAGCELQVKRRIDKLEGIAGSTVSYEKRKAAVQFDNTRMNTDKIAKAINSTGYTVVKYKILL